MIYPPSYVIFPLSSVKYAYYIYISFSFLSNLLKKKRKLKHLYTSEIKQC